MAGVSCVGAESLGRLWGREEPSMKGGAKFAWSRGGFIGKCGEFVGDFLVSQSSNPDVGRRLVESCCSGLPMKSLGNRYRKTSGWH